MAKLIKCDICGETVPDNRGIFYQDIAVELPKPIEYNYGTKTHDYYRITISRVVRQDTFREPIDICESCLSMLIGHVKTKPS